MFPVDFLGLWGLLQTNLAVFFRGYLKVLPQLFLGGFLKLVHDVALVVFSLARKYEFFSHDFVLLFQLQLSFAILLQFFLSFGQLPLEISYLLLVLCRLWQVHYFFYLRCHRVAVLLHLVEGFILGQESYVVGGFIETFV